jgi:predicted ATPase
MGEASRGIRTLTPSLIFVPFRRPPMIRRVHVQRFRSIVDQVFEPSALNVLVGANGSGKSALLEAIGVLGAAAEGRIDDTSLQRKGVRLSAPTLYASAFSVADDDAHDGAISLAVSSENGATSQYAVSLRPPPDEALHDVGAWRYERESLSGLDGAPIITRGRDSLVVRLSEPGWDDRLFSIERSAGAAAMLTRVGDGFATSHALFDALRRFVIYDPQTPVLRGTSQDTAQQSPIGLQGGKLAEAVKAVLHSGAGVDVAKDAIAEWIDWARELSVVPSSEARVSPSIPVTPEVLSFTDRFLAEGRNTLSGYDASEGALYVLFALVLLFHPRTPPFFAVEHLDHALHPRLARRLVATLADHVVSQRKQIILTTHNPLVLDGLDLSNDAIRLFTIERSIVGHTQVRRVEYSSALQSAEQSGQTLSQMWVRGLLGGVPEIV